MPRPSAAILPAFVPTALAASQVGTWRCSPSTGLVRGDAIMAGIFGFDADQVWRGIPLMRLRERILPADRHMFDHKNETVAERGGSVVLELRVVPWGDEVRWVLVRGCYEREAGVGETGACVGHGIVVDITNVKVEGHAPPGAFYAVAPPIPGDEPTPLQDTIDAALALHGQVSRLGEEVPGLRATMDMVVLLLGRRLAQDVDRSDLE